MGFEREFLRSALTLAAASEVHHLLYVHDRPVPAELLRGRRCRRKLLYAVTSETLAKQLIARKERAILIPSYDSSRVDRVKVALVSVTAAGGLLSGSARVVMLKRASLPMAIPSAS